MAWEIVLGTGILGMALGMVIGSAMAQRTWLACDDVWRGLVKMQRGIIEQQDARIEELTDGKEG